MTQRSKHPLILGTLLFLGAAIFLTGIDWGLPSRRIDRFLFGSEREAWLAKKIQEAAAPWSPDPNRASDVDQNPIGEPPRPVVLNQTPAQQAEIIRRFRLFSDQPDEMVTFMALARMRGGRYDPGMYQYGGLWIYPVGGLVKIASKLGLVQLNSDMGYYLDNPEQFGRFYVVARCYSALWGLVGIWAVYRLARRMSDGLLLPAGAAAGFLFMPVIVNAAHEAKPHLAGAVLVLLTVLAAVKFLETGRKKYWVLAGVACGAAMGMVLSGAAAGAVLVMMGLLGKGSWWRRIAGIVGAGAVAIGVFCLSNPYLLINLRSHPEIVKSNLGTLSRSKAVGGAVDLKLAIPNAAGLIAEGASPVVAVVGVCAGLYLMVAGRRGEDKGTRGHGDMEREKDGGGRRVGEGGGHRLAADATAVLPLVLLAAPAVLVLIQFTLLAAHKFGEYGRFAILPDVLLLLLTIAALDRLVVRPAWRFVAAEILIAAVAFFGMCYVAGFLENRTRIDAARVLESLPASAKTIAVRDEPAPYDFPPVQVDRWRILLVPEGCEMPVGGERPDVILRPVDDRSSAPPESSGYRRMMITGRWPIAATRISWADKVFVLDVRAELLAR